MDLFYNVFYSGLLFIVLGFISGSVPYGFLYSLARGVDIRKIGSGNIGATNVTRQFGFWQGFLPIALLDGFKGAIPVIIFRLCVSRELNESVFDTMEILVGMAAILGHIFSPFLGFKGGKGVATTAGVLLTWNYIVGLTLIASFGLIFFTIGKKTIGRASVGAAICFPIIAFFVPNTTMPLSIVSVVISILILVTHRKNIKEWYTGQDLVKKMQEKMVKEQEKMKKVQKKLQGKIQKMQKKFTDEHSNKK